MFQLTLNGKKRTRLKTGTLDVRLLDSNNNPIYLTEGNNEIDYAIDLSNQYPISDKKGLEQEGFTFKVKNFGSLTAEYTLYLDDVPLEEGEERMLDQYIKYSLTKNGSEDFPELLPEIGSNPNRILDRAVLLHNQENSYTLKVWVDINADNESMGKVFDTTLRVEVLQHEEDMPFFQDTLAYKAYTQEEVKTLTAPIRNGFDSTTETNGLYKYTDSDGTTIYPYRGTSVNNYVTFAEQTWRILNIQLDGSVKIIRQDPLTYVNTDYVSDTSATSVKKVVYNKSFTSVNNNKYSGSNVEGYVNAWYNDVMKENYNRKIASNMYCSDRYIDTTSQGKTELWTSYNPLYGVYNRLTFENKNDVSTYQWAPNVSCVSGDKIEVKAALITADEYILAGGGKNTVSNYLKKNNYVWWMMSPFGTPMFTESYVILGDGSISYYRVSSTASVYPVITLKADLAVSSGDGTSSKPYVIE